MNNVFAWLDQAPVSAPFYVIMKETLWDPQLLPVSESYNSRRTDNPPCRGSFLILFFFYSFIFARLYEILISASNLELFVVVFAKALLLEGQGKGCICAMFPIFDYGLCVRVILFLFCFCLFKRRSWSVKVSHVSALANSSSHAPEHFNHQCTKAGPGRRAPDSSALSGSLLLARKCVDVQEISTSPYLVLL